MDAPDIFAYHDFREYLEDWFQYRKTVKPHTSHRQLSRFFGSTDPSFFSRITSGRRPLPDARIPQFCRLLDLEGLGARRFELLVRRAQARDREVRQRADAALADLDRQRAGPNLDAHNIGEHWYYVAIRELVALAGFRRDPGWIAQALRPRIAEREAAHALDQLVAWGLLREREDGTLEQAEPMAHSDALVLDWGGVPHHRENHAHAGRFLARLADHDEEAHDQTAFFGTTIPIPASRLPQLRELLYELQYQVGHQCEAFPEPRDVVVQVNIQLFPVSERVSPRD